MRHTIRFVAAAFALATLVALTGCGDGGQEIKPVNAGGTAQPLPAPKSPADGGGAPAPKNKPGGGPAAQ